MAFLDNSGDIILDAVLTDAGRQRMARGQFKIAKYAFGDEEINYSLYNSNHPSGSAYSDIEIMQTPVLEAITNNTATMRSKLMSLGRTNILYLPILKTNTAWDAASGVSKTQTALGENAGYYTVSANKALEDAISSDAGQAPGEPPGMMFGANNATSGRNYICVEQGMMTGGDPGIIQQMDPSLLETQYIVQIDHRLGRIMSTFSQDRVNEGRQVGQAPLMQRYSFVDDDNIATYYFGFGSDRDMVRNIQLETTDFGAKYDDWKAQLPWDGPLGSRLVFRIKASLNLQQSDALFTKLNAGNSTKKLSVRNANGTVALLGGGGGTALKYIDSSVRVTGVTTGYSIDIPVRYLMKS